MKKPLHLIYIPGLGDTRVSGQMKAISTWRWYGVTAELVQMNWANNEPWQQKFDRLLARIDAARASGHDVGLVAASAGATAAINSYAARKADISGVVLIAGKVNRPAAIGQTYHRRNPAFITSAQDCQQALASLGEADRRRILSRFGVIDEVVARADSFIPGACNRTVPSVGHFVTIATQLVFGAPSFIRFLKRQQQKNII